MKGQEKHKAEILKSVVVENHKKKSEMVFIMMGDTYKGVTLYKVYSMSKEDGGNIGIKDTEDTYNERIANHYFNLLISTYLRKNN